MVLLGRFLVHGTLAGLSRCCFFFVNFTRRLCGRATTTAAPQLSTMSELWHTGRRQLKMCTRTISDYFLSSITFLVLRLVGIVINDKRKFATADIGQS